MHSILHSLTCGYFKETLFPMNYYMDCFLFLTASCWFCFGCLVAVDLPPWFSSMSVSLESDVDLVSVIRKLSE